MGAVHRLERECNDITARARAFEQCPFWLVCGHDTVYIPGHDVLITRGLIDKQHRGKMDRYLASRSLLRDLTCCRGRGEETTNPCDNSTNKTHRAYREMVD